MLLVLRRRCVFLFLLFTAHMCGFGAGPAVLLEERFEDDRFAARGWYDNTGFMLSSLEHIPGSSKSAEFRWLRGGTTPVTGGAFRRKFTPAEAVYVSYWVKYRDRK